MKPVFKCDYCDFMGTEKAVKEHEPKCTENYTRRSCLTCKHAEQIWLLANKVTCKLGKEVPNGKMYEFCPSYEKRATDKDDLGNIFSGLFGG